MIRIILIPVFTLTIGFCLGNGTPEPQTNMEFSAYPEQLPGHLTGGFGEDTCHSCHFDYPLNYEEGKLRINGFPELYKPGQSYSIQIIVERSDLKKAGFQVSSRFADGSQAGSFNLRSDRTQFTAADSASVQYVQHSSKGSEKTDTGQAVWTVEWTAPEKSQQISIHLAANAANGDASEFGDYILTKEILLKVHR